jgi:hypothetical protein
MAGLADTALVENVPAIKKPLIGVFSPTPKSPILRQNLTDGISARLARLKLDNNNAPVPVLGRYVDSARLDGAFLAAINNLQTVLKLVDLSAKGALEILLKTKGGRNGIFDRRVGAPIGALGFLPCVNSSLRDNASRRDAEPVCYVG